MLGQEMKDIVKEFQKPWPAEQICEFESGGRRMVYSEVWVYQNRLDEVMGMDWEARIEWPFANDQQRAERGDNWRANLGDAVCALTIYWGGKSYTRWAHGEADPTFGAAEAQAFKRACSGFGIGRFLYSYDGPALGKGGGNEAPRNFSNSSPPSSGAANFQSRTNGNTWTEKQERFFDVLGFRAYGKSWATARNDLLVKFTGGEGRQPTKREASEMIDEVKHLADQKSAVDSPPPPPPSERFEASEEDLF